MKVKTIASNMGEVQKVLFTSPKPDMAVKYIYLEGQELLLEFGLSEF